MKTKLNKATGDLSIKCQRSGRPINRVNDYGMFCDAEVCQCELDSIKLCGGADPKDPTAMLEKLFGPLGFDECVGETNDDSKST